MRLRSQEEARGDLLVSPRERRNAGDDLLVSPRERGTAMEIVRIAKENTSTNLADLPIDEMSTRTTKSKTALMPRILYQAWIEGPLGATWGTGWQESFYQTRFLSGGAGRIVWSAV
jgi:hypothetical protein